MIVFEHGPPLIVVLAAVAAAAAVGAISAYRRLPRNAGNAALAFLYVLILGGLFWTLLQPGRRDAAAHRIKPRFLVLLDTSRSMTVRPRDDVETRWRRARRVLVMPWVHRVGAEADLALYPFDAGLGERRTLRDAADDLVATGDSTRLRDSLQALAARYTGLNVAGLLLLSDGIDTREALDDWAADPLPFPVYTVRLEDDEEWVQEPDVRIEAVLTPRRVSRGWESELRAVVSGQGTQGQPLTVQLFRDGQWVDEKPTRIPALGGQREVVFPLRHPEVGVFTYRVFVPPLAGESQVENNEHILTISVSDPRNRLLYVEGVPRFEYRFLRRALLASEQLVPAIFFTGPDGAPISGTPSGGATPEMTEADLLQFKIVILGNLDAGEIGDARAADLVRFVESGGSLVLLGGTRGWGEQGFIQTPLRSVLPVRAHGTATLEGTAPFPVRLTPEGRAHPAFAGEDDLWAAVPPVLGVFPDARPTAGAEVLVEVETPRGPHPLVVAQRYGQGRVAAVLTDSLWRWQLAPDTARQQPYLRFWTQLLSWMLPDEDAGERRGLDLFASRDQAHLGETVELSARFTEAAGAGDGRVEARITRPDGRTVPYAMSPQPVVTPVGRSFPGFHLAFAAEEPGHYTAVAAHGTGAEALASDPVSFFVRPFSPETEPRAIRADLLRALAAAGGGTFYESLDEMNRGLEALPIHAIEEERSEYRSLWQTWPLLLALMLALTASWALRKFRHMP